MGADPIQAARNITEAEKRANDIRVLVARGLISDLVRELARLMANRTACGPEEIKLQDQILKDALSYVRACNSGPGIIEYLSPIEQARRVDEQSNSRAELERLDAARQEALDKIADEMDRDVQKALSESETEVVPFGLPKAKASL